MQTLRVLIAPDSWKGSLAAGDVARAIERGLRRFCSTWDVRRMPMADGGEGTMEAVQAARGGRLVEVRVQDAYGRPRAARFLMLDDGTALVEAAAGPGFLPAADRPAPADQAHSYGLGQLMKAALDDGATRLAVTLGGTGSSDGGMGMLRALGGWCGDDAVPLGAQQLGQVPAVRLPSVPVPMECWTDVDSPLTGPRGAIFRFGPQKGLASSELAALDQAMRCWGEALEAAAGAPLVERAGAGAAGGLGVALMALGAVVRPGGRAVAEIIGLPRAVSEADVVITGEGRIDGQSAGGKVVATVAALAHAAGKPVVGLAGMIGDEAEVLYAKGLTALFPAHLRPTSLEDAMAGAEAACEEASVHLGAWIQALAMARP